MKKVVIYTGIRCAHCDWAVALLKKKNNNASKDLVFICLEAIFNLEKILAFLISSADKISTVLIKSPDIYTFNEPILSPSFMGASIGPVYSIVAFTVFFFLFGIVK